MPVRLPKKFAPLAPWFDRHRRPCWLPTSRAGDGKPTASKFGGCPWLADAEPWPTCRECGGPMSLFLQLELATLPDDARQHVGDAGLFQAFFCTQSDCINGEEGCKPFARTHLLRVVDPAAAKGGGRPEPDRDPDDDTNDEDFGDVTGPIPARRITGWKAVDDYPSMTEAEQLGLRLNEHDRVVCKGIPFSVESDLDEFGGLPWSRCHEKLGGWPCWVNIRTAYPKCRKCKTTMRNMLFQFGYGGPIPVMFGDGGQGYVVNCPNHPSLFAYPWSSS